MVVSLRKLTKAAIGDFEIRPRHEWATMHASQVSNVYNSGMGQSTYFSLMHNILTFEVLLVLVLTAL